MSQNASEDLYKCMLRKNVSQNIWSALRAIENYISQLSHACATTGLSKLQVLRGFFHFHSLNSAIFPWIPSRAE